MVEALRDARGVRHGLVAGARALPLLLEFHINDGLNGIQTEALPAILDLDVGQSEAVLQRPGHLQSTMLAKTALGAADNETADLGDLCPPKHFARNFVWLGHGGAMAVSDVQRDQRLICSGGSSRGGCG